MRREAANFFSQPLIKPVPPENAFGETQSSIGRHARQILEDFVDGAPAGHSHFGTDVTAGTHRRPNLMNDIRIFEQPGGSLLICFWQNRGHPAPGWIRPIAPA